MVANMAAGLLAEPRPGRGAGVPDKTQRVGPLSAVEAHPKHSCEQSQRETLTQALKQTERGARPALQGAHITSPLCLNDGLTRGYTTEPENRYICGLWRLTKVSQPLELVHIL